MFSYGLISEGKPIRNVTITVFSDGDDRSNAYSASYPTVDGFEARYAKKLPEVVMRNARNRLAEDGAIDVRLFPVG